jgi:hypothetical protein
VEIVPSSSIHLEKLLKNRGQHLHGYFKDFLINVTLQCVVETLPKLSFTLEESETDTGARSHQEQMRRGMDGTQ